jgi:curved DNA-binding protein CbpA
MQTLLDKNFFDIFGLDEAFALDQGGLRERFRNMQRKFHPDNYATASEAEKRISAQYAAHINEAFTTLKDPVLRARYILSQHGVSLHEKSHMDTSFLMEQMELRDDLDYQTKLTRTLIPGHPSWKKCWLIRLVQILMMQSDWFVNCSSTTESSRRLRRLKKPG